jgi:hypothetical protein
VRGNQSSPGTNRAWGHRKHCRLFFVFDQPGQAIARSNARCIAVVGVIRIWAVGRNRIAGSVVETFLTTRDLTNDTLDFAIQELGGSNPLVDHKGQAMKFVRHIAPVAT